MKCVRVALEVDVKKYEAGKGMEDGVELWSDERLVCHGFPRADQEGKRCDCMSLYSA